MIIALIEDSSFWSTFWTALSAIGTCVAVVYAVYQTRLAQKQTEEERKKADPKNWLSLEYETFDLKENQVSLKLQFKNSGLVKVYIKFVQVHIASDFYNFAYKECILIEPYENKVLSLFPYHDVSFIPTNKRKTLKQIKDFSKKIEPIFLLVETNVGTFNFWIEKDKSALFISTLISVLEQGETK